MNAPVRRPQALRAAGILVALAATAAAQSSRERVAPGAAGPEWPQHARTAAHEGHPNSIDDRIRSPGIAWRVEHCFGEPTLSGGDVYSGGRGLFRIDPATGAVLARVLAPEEATEDGKEPPVTVAEAPAIAGDVVLARRTLDGGVTAFERSLAAERWSWPGAGAGACPFTGCLAGELFVVAHGPSVVALRVADGSQAWRFEAAGAVNMVPASADGRVYFGEEGGLFYALELASGAEAWRKDTGGWLGWTDPVVVEKRVVFGDRGGSRARPAGGGNGERGGHVWALDAKDGDELWSTEFGATGLSLPGIGDGYVVAGFSKVVARFDLKRGKLDQGHLVRTGANAFGSPSVVGESLVFGNLDGNLYVHDLDDGRLSWRFHVPEGQVHDFVHLGERAYVATTKGLYCIADDGRTKRLAPGFVLEAPKEE